MSTTNSEITYTSKALDILSCFMGEFDDLVLDVAEQIARQERPEGNICINARHVHQAGDRILVLLREKLGNEVDEAMSDFIENTHECLGLRPCDDEE